MKKLALLLCTAVLLMMACQKEEPTPNEVDEAHAAPAQNYPSTAEVIYDALTDIDGNHYDAVKIGNQIWMASNLRTTRYADGEAIPDGKDTYGMTVPFRYQPQTDLKSGGYLYNWIAVMRGRTTSSDANPSGVQGICPNGWHVPSDAEWDQLTDYLSSHSEFVCSGSGTNIAKSLADDRDWNLDTWECSVGNDLSVNNATGFSALPVGIFSEANYYGLGNSTSFWTTTIDCPTKSTYRNIMYALPTVNKNCGLRSVGNSVRCVKD